MLTVNNLTVRYGNLTIINDICFGVRPEQWLMIVGPNGAGKSTIVGAISRGVAYTGSVAFEGTDIRTMKPAQLARNIGFLTQSHTVGYSFSVEEVVKLGRYAYSSGIFSSTDAEDDRKIEAAIEITGMKPFRKQSVLTLSGGELQRTFLAQLLAQDPKLLILDEPTNHLDLVYQKQMFELIKEWIKNTGRAVVSVVHDLNLARAYGTDAVLLDQGAVVSSGPIREVLTAENLQSVYSMDVYGWMRKMLSQWVPEESQQPNRSEP
jgi:iron complex transport system ATP-binding protein